MNQKIKKFVIDRNKSIKEAIKKINTNGQKTCFVLDENKRLYGSITDGDIRRRILKNEKSINDKIQKYCNKKTKYIFADNYSLKKIKKIFLAKKIEILPILNNNKKIVDITLKSEVFNLKKKKENKTEKLQIKFISCNNGWWQRSKIRPNNQNFSKAACSNQRQNCN